MSLTKEQKDELRRKARELKAVKQPLEAVHAERYGESKEPVETEEQRFRRVMNDDSAWETLGRT